VRTYERQRGLLRAPRLLWDVAVRGRYDFVYDQMPMTVRRMSPAKRANLIRSGANLLHRRLRPWSMPLHMQFELTSFCNLRCPICPTGIRAVERRAQVLDVDLFRDVLAEVGPHLLTASLWGWGEPLLHPQLADALRAIEPYGCATLLSTNGQNLDDERVISALLAAPPTYLILAIDGLTDETNSRFRIGAKLAPILDGVRRITALRRERGGVLPVLHMRFIVMKHNQHEVPQLLDFARAHGFDLLTVRTLSIIDTESETPHRELVPDDPAYRAYAYDAGTRAARSDYVCFEPFWFPTLFADGTLVACEQDYNAQQSLGVIGNGVGFRDLWYGEHARSIRRRIREEANALSFCRNCPYRDRETTDCSIAAHVLNPEIDYRTLVGGTL